MAGLSRPPARRRPAAACSATDAQPAVDPTPLDGCERDRCEAIGAAAADRDGCGAIPGGGVRRRRRAGAREACRAATGATRSYCASATARCAATGSAPMRPRPARSSRSRPPASRRPCWRASRRSVRGGRGRRGGRDAVDRREARSRRRPGGCTARARGGIVDRGRDAACWSGATESASAIRSCARRCTSRARRSDAGSRMPAAAELLLADGEAVGARRGAPVAGPRGLARLDGRDAAQAAAAAGARGAPDVAVRCSGERSRKPSRSRGGPRRARGGGVHRPGSRDRRRARRRWRWQRRRPPGEGRARRSRGALTPMGRSTRQSRR